MAPVAVGAQTEQTKQPLKSRTQYHGQQQQYRYDGVIDVRVIEPKGAQYILGVKFKSGYAKPVQYTLRYYNGKAAQETFKAFYQQNNGDDIRRINITHKYYTSFRIRENNDKTFTARVKLFQRRKDKTIDINQPYQFSPDDFKAIQSQPIEGEFNQDNEYLFVDTDDVKFYIKLNFDLIFTREEIIQRFNNSEK